MAWLGILAVLAVPYCIFNCVDRDIKVASIRARERKNIELCIEFCFLGEDERFEAQVVSECGIACQSLSERGWVKIGEVLEFFLWNMANFEWLGDHECFLET